MRGVAGVSRHAGTSWIERGLPPAMEWHKQDAAYAGATVAAGALVAYLAAANFGLVPAPVRVPTQNARVEEMADLLPIPGVAPRPRLRRRARPEVRLVAIPVVRFVTPSPTRAPVRSVTPPQRTPARPPATLRPSPSPTTPQRT